MSQAAALRLSRWRPPSGLGTRILVSMIAAGTVAFVAGYHEAHYLFIAVEVAVAGGLVLLGARYPATSLGVLVVFLPFSVIILSVLFHFGMPATVIRGMGAVKDIVVLGILVAAIRAGSQERRRLDIADKFLLIYIGFATVYLILPRVFPLGLDLLRFSVTSLAWRTDVSFAILILALRHLPIRESARRRVEATILVVGVGLAAGGLYEYASPLGWFNLLTQDIHVQPYLLQILHSASTVNYLYYETHGGGPPQRVTSLFFSPTVLGFYLLLPLGIALRQASSRRSRLAVPAILVLTGCLVLTLTRSAVLSGIVLVLVYTWYATAGKHSGRARLVMLVLALAVAAIPLAAVTGLGSRTASAVRGTDQSAITHGTDLRTGLERMAASPLGQGLGTVAGVGTRYKIANRVTSEDAYIQIGNEIGLVPLGAFALFLISLLLVLHRRTKEPSADADRAAAAAAILAGLIVGGFFQEIWLDFSQTLTAATILGLASRPPPTDLAQPSSGTRVDSRRPNLPQT